MRAVAVIKLGSTSSRLVVASRLTRPLADEYQMLSLMAADAEETLNLLLADWHQRLARWQVSPLVAGGEALRRRPHLIRVIQRYFSRVWWLDGPTEGRLAWMGVVSANPSAGVVIDVGGGSTEVVTSRASWSFPVGAATLPQSVVWPEIRVAHPVFVGGTARVLGEWCGGSRFTREDVHRLSDVAEGVEKVPGLSLDPGRLPLLTQGLAVIDEMMAHSGWSAATGASQGLTEGLWLAASLGRGD